MPPRSSTDRAGLQRDVRSLQRLTAGLKTYDHMPDVQCWEHVTTGLTFVLGNSPGKKIEVASDFWVSSSTGQAALECMQAIIEHAPAAMRTAASSRQDQTSQLGILVVPNAVCWVLNLINQYSITLPAAWPTGLKSAASALAEVAVLLPHTALTDPFVMTEITRILDYLSTGEVDLPLRRKVDLILVQLKSFTFAIGSKLKSGEDIMKYKLYSSDSNYASTQWYSLMGRASLEMLSRLDSPEADLKEWQRLIPVMVKSFQLAREIIHKNLFSDQYFIDGIYSFGLGIPLQFLRPFGDVAAKWRLRCTLQAARLLSMLRERPIQHSNVAAEVPLNVSAPAEVPRVNFLSPSKHVEIGILQAVAVLARQIDTGPFRNSISQGIKNQQQHFEMMAMAEEAVRLFAEISHPETLPDTMTFVKAMLRLVSSFVLHQAGLPDESATYSPTRENDLRSSIMKVISMLKTSAKVSALSLDVFISQNVNTDWIRLYNNIWRFESSKQPGGIWGFLGLPCLLPLLEMLPTMAMMLNMRGTCNRAGEQSLDQPNNDADLDSQASSAQIASNALASIASFLITIGAHQALVSPTLCLDILTSQPAWAILETIGRSLVPDQEARHSSIFDIETLPQPTTSYMLRGLFRAAGAIPLTAFLTCLVDQIFRHTASFPSALMKKWDVYFLPNSDFMTVIGENRQSLPFFMQALSSVHFVQADTPQPHHFLSSFTRAISIVSPSEPLTEALDDPASGPDDSPAGALDQLSVLSHIVSNGIWEVLIDYHLTSENSASLAAYPMTLSLYQAAAIAEMLLSSSANNGGGGRGVVMDASTEKLWEDCRAGIEKALLVLHSLTEIENNLLTSPSSSSSSNIGGDRRVVMTDVFTEQQLQDGRAGIEKALLSRFPHIEENAGAASICQQSSSQTTSLSSASGSVSWFSALRLLRSSLFQLRELLKTSCNKPFVPRDWELIKAELMPHEAEEVWGVSSCCNASCTRFEGACEVEVKTLTCGGMCGARYCCRACQEQAWRAGHRRTCGALKEMQVLAKQRKKPVEALNDSMIALHVNLLQSKDPRDQAKAAKALFGLASDKDVNQIKIATAGAIPHLVALLGPLSSAEVQKGASSALLNIFGINPDIWVNIPAAHVILPLTRLLEPHYSVDLQSMATRTLRFLSSSGGFGCGVNIIAAGGVPALVTLLGPHSPPEVQRDAAGILGDLSNMGPFNQMKIAAAGAIAPLVALLGPRNSSEVHAIAAEVLRDLSHMNASNLAEIVAAGAIPLLITLLGPQNAVEVQERAAEALSNLSNTADSKVKIVSAGAISPLVALLGPQSSSKLQKIAAGALSNLSIKNPDNQLEIAAAGAIIPLVALLGPENSSEVQARASGALSNLSNLNAANTVKIAAEGAIPPLVALLGPHSAAEVQEKAANALRNMASSTSDSKIKRAMGDAIPHLVALLGTRNSADVQHIAADALNTLAHGSGYNQFKIITAGAIPALVALLGPESPTEVQATAAAMLSNLSSVNYNNSVKIVEAGAIPPLVALLELQSSSKEHSNAVWALCNLSENYADCRGQIVSSGAIPALVALLGPESTAEVQEPSAWVLRGISSTVDCKIQIVAAGAIPPLVDLLGPRNSALAQKNAVGVLGSIAINNADGCSKIRSAGGVAALNQLLSLSSTNADLRKRIEAVLHHLITSGG